jgi:hypothetical protein
MKAESSLLSARHVKGRVAVFTVALDAGAGFLPTTKIARELKPLLVNLLEAKNRFAELERSKVNLGQPESALDVDPASTVFRLL